MKITITGTNDITLYAQWIESKCSSLSNISCKRQGNPSNYKFGLVFNQGFGIDFFGGK